MPASHTGNGFKFQLWLLTPVSNQRRPWRQQCRVQVTAFLTLTWKTWIKLPARAHPSPSHCRHLGSEHMDASSNKKIQEVCERTVVAGFSGSLKRSMNRMFKNSLSLSLYINTKCRGGKQKQIEDLPPLPVFITSFVIHLSSLPKSLQGPTSLPSTTTIIQDLSISCHLIALLQNINYT